MNQDSLTSCFPFKRRGRRRREERERHRLEILRAALRVFSEKGYHRATMQEIAAVADFAVGTIYRFFPSKKALYEAVVTEQAEAFHQEMMVVFSTLPEDPFEALRSVIAHRLELVRKYLIFIRMYLTELWEVRFRGGLTPQIKNLYEEYLTALSLRLEELCPPGLSARRLASLIDGLLATLIVEAIEGEQPLPSVEEVLSFLSAPLIRRSDVT